MVTLADHPVVRMRHAVARLLVSTSVCLLIACVGQGNCSPNEDLRISGPVSGMVYDRWSGTIRSMIGVPGSSWLSAPLLDEVRFFVTAPDSQTALAVHRNRVVVLSGTELTEVAGVPSTIAGAAWSADATAAVAWAGETVYLLKRDGQGLTLIRSSTVTQPPECIHAAVVSNDGRMIIATAGTDAGALYFLDDGEPALLSHTGSPADLVLAGDRSYAADRKHSRIVAVSLRDGVLSPLLESGDGISTPIAVSASADGKWLYVANAGGRRLDVYDTETKAVSGTSVLEYAMCGMQAMRHPALFVMHPCDEAAPFLVATGASTRPALYFVPAHGAN